MAKMIDERMRIGPRFGARADRAWLLRRRQAAIVIVAAIAVTASVALGHAVANESATSLDHPVGQTLAAPISQPSSTVRAGAISLPTSVDINTAGEPSISDLQMSRARSVGSPSDDAGPQPGPEVGVAVGVEIERSVEDGQDRAAVTVRLRTQIDDQEDDGHTFATLYCDTGQVSATVCDTVDDVGPVRVHAELGASSEPEQ